MRKLFSVHVIVGVFLFFSLANAQTKERPFIWVQESDRSQILNKIEEKSWAKSYYSGFISRLDEKVSAHQANPDAFLRGIPFDWERQQAGETPPFPKTTYVVDGKQQNLDNAPEEDMANFWRLDDYLQTGIDCGVAYYLTNDEKYAQCAVDILNASIKGLIQLEPSEWKGRGGWLAPYDLLRESRVIGEKLPIIYDFVAPFIKKGGRPYDIGKKTKIDFPIAQAQQVFRTYAQLVVNHGMINSNHPVLEAPCLVYNALALNDENERNKYLEYYLTKNTEHQDALSKIAKEYEHEGEIWPESSQYTNGVASKSTFLMFILTKYDPSLHLGQKYPNIPLALQRLDYLVYPNGELIRWGDGHRDYDTPYESYEMAYQLGKVDGVKKLTSTFGALLGNALANGEYKRDGGMRALLWYSRDLEAESDPIKLPRPDQVPHAGIFLQRNLSSTNNPEDGLMCFVGGAHMVHGHAEGMNIELYGQGEVLGVDNGRGSYAQDIHENYSRLYAAHNTVIVNGSSRGKGGWVNLGINTVQLKSMEPMPGEEAVSPNYSFSQTSFVDDKGEKAEAEQQRTLALVRTSNNTGYYVDVFRSKSQLPNQYHDYLYHNIGDKLVFENKDLTLEPTPERYMASANKPWVRNRQYRNPGWHFFEEVQTSSRYNENVKGYFSTGKLKGDTIYMGFHIPGFHNRDYTKVKAPRTFEAPEPYHKMSTPTLLVRNRGETWTTPFVVVYEPFEGNLNNRSIQSVEKLEQDGNFKGLIVTSKVEQDFLVQYIIDQGSSQSFVDSTLGIEFKGRFAIITTNEKDKLLNMYIGNGQEIRFGDYHMVSQSGKNVGGFLDLSTSEPQLKSNGQMVVTKKGSKIKYRQHEHK